jgi:hypothetical protein
MHFRRLASIAVGGWLAGSILVLAFTSYNSRNIEPLVRLAPKPAAEIMVRIQEDDIRGLMHYHADDANRWAWSTWEVAQIVLGLVVLLSLFFSAGGKRYSLLLGMLMLAVAGFQHLLLTPQMNKLALSTIFSSPRQISVERDRLASLQSAYKMTEAGKLGLGVLLAWSLLKRGRRREAEIE